MKNRVVKTIVAISLSVAILLSCSVFSYAYFAKYTIKSSDWDVLVGSKYTYPDVDKGWIDSVYSYSDLNGDTCFYSGDWIDDFVRITDTDLYFPFFSNDYFPFFFIFRYLDTFYRVSWWESDPLYWAYDFIHNQLYFSPSIETSIEIWSLSYPYTDWVFETGIDLFNINEFKVFCDLTFSEFPLLYSNVPVFYLPDRYGELDIYNPYWEPDDYDLFSTPFHVEFYKPLSVLTTSATVTISSKDLIKLSNGSYAMRIDDTGFIACTNMSLAYIRCVCKLSSTLMDFDFGTFPVCEYYYFDSYYSDRDINAGDAFIIDDVSLIDFSGITFDDSIDFVFTFLFVSDAFTFFFPGTFELIEFADYEEDEHHNATLEAIQKAASDISSSVNSAADKIVSGMKDIFTSDTGVPEFEYDDVLTPDLEEQDAILDDIFSKLNDDLDKAVKKLGYSSYEMFFQDNVGQLDTTFHYGFLAVANLFDRVVGVTDVMVLLIFSLVFGFCIYILGRRLN